MDIQLLIQAKDKPEKKVTINTDVVIGRSQTCQFRVLSNDVSREHCRIVVSDDSVAVRDLGSSNGTVVNGQTIPPLADFPLSPGAKLVVGPLTVVFDFPSKIATPTPTVEQTKPTVELTQKATSKTVAPTATAVPQKTKSHRPARPPAAVEEPTFLSSVASPEDGFSSDEPTWPSFGDDDFSEGRTIDTAAMAQEPNSAGSMADFGFEEPEAATPVASEPAPIAPITAAPQVAAIDVGESSDEPIFGEFDPSAEFDFDSDQAAEAIPTAIATASAATPSATSQPSKLKSLFGLFSKGKKDTASLPPKTETAAQAPVSAESSPLASADIESPLDFGADASGDDVTGWLLGGTGSPPAEPAATVPAPTPPPARKPTKKVAQPTTAKQSPAPTPAPVVETGPSIAAAPVADNEPDFNDFFSQLGN